ncbi:MAG: hypothetical protein AVDCRST_MAG56-986 [uncultured Cytophagales bacterium]|uniref:Uncharacterized protein n=1 Tax=uncultured Cytophagales bacterium TaxID=158755 RepID=A0A6J4HSK2_9SPHI|nr:MAG: hypothetical protein AVDCRST_MAG56-986 [uncultured Cytophagales bacterium]
MSTKIIGFTDNFYRAAKKRTVGSGITRKCVRLLPGFSEPAHRVNRVP